MATVCRVQIRRNGTTDVTKECIVPASFQEFLAKAGTKLGVTQAKRAYSASGAEVDDVEDLLHGEIIYISAGEPFITPSSSAPTASGSKQESPQPISSASPNSAAPTPTKVARLSAPSHLAPKPSTSTSTSASTAKPVHVPATTSSQPTSVAPLSISGGPSTSASQPNSATVEASKSPKSKKKSLKKEQSGPPKGMEFAQWSESERFGKWRQKVNQITHHISSQYLRPQDKRQGLLNYACASIISEPRYYNLEDGGRASMVKLAVGVVNTDPEFIFKLALYIRVKLHVRTTPNFLLSLAAHMKPTQPFIKKYFKHIIKTPGDLLEFVNLYRTVPNRLLSAKSLPRSTRKVICEKFCDFDTYQLGKYCSESERKSRNAKKKPALAMGQLADAVNFERDSDAEEDEYFSNKVTMKRVIQSLHISEPRKHVLPILGLRYPKTAEQFQEMRLPGEFQASQAGKRMRLPSPYTWECVISQKGNTTKSWEELISSRRLPFFALLRNLRNIIKNNVSEQHQKTVIDRITNAEMIQNSGTLPLKFLSAEKAIFDYGTKLRNEQEAIQRKKQKEARAKVLVNVKDKKAAPTPQKQVPKGKATPTKATPTKATPTKAAPTKAAPAKPDSQQHDSKKVAPNASSTKPKPKKALNHEHYLKSATPYVEALRRATEISITQNVKPIKGRTIILCDIGKLSKTPTRGKASPLRDLRGVAVLLSLLVHRRASSTCIIRGYAGKNPESTENDVYELVVDKNATLLKNIERLSSIEVPDTPSEFPLRYLSQLIDYKVVIDNLIIFSASPSYENASQAQIQKAITHYRQTVDPDLKVFCVDISGKGAQLLDVNSKDLSPNDVLISGSSEAILSFISEREASQMEKVQRIDFELGLVKSVALEDTRVNYEDIPKNFVCAITREVMENPVLASDGHTYEESAIKHWFSKSRISPLTGLLLDNLDLTPNHALKSLIVTWKERIAEAVAQKIEEHKKQIQEEQNKLQQQIEKSVGAIITSLDQQREETKERDSEIKKAIEKAADQQAEKMADVSQKMEELKVVVVEQETETREVITREAEKIDEALAQVSEDVQVATASINALVSAILGADFTLDVEMSEFKLQGGPTVPTPVYLGTVNENMFFRLRQNFRRKLYITIAQPSLADVKFLGVQKVTLSNILLRNEDMTLVTDGQASSTFSVELPVESFISRQTQNECKVVCVLDIEVFGVSRPFFSSLSF
eukprot:TRINITY_DN2392_c0_g1_i1.p1 TRINITY_DN2392_c0_g1~~TRINITY_DN2392_c0_g1_i1.p1  ORF type:complete len:1217 (-),score=287.76 TRINITY_DN2392_c0_g1_i1:604-4254(-)